jgi:hypothetical protein
MDARTFTPEEPKPVEYVAPEVTDYGKLTDITAGQASGSFTDRTFPTNTPFSDLTFSS